MIGHLNTLSLCLTLVLKDLICQPVLWIIAKRLSFEGEADEL